MKEAGQDPELPDEGSPKKYQGKLSIQGKTKLYLSPPLRGLAMHQSKLNYLRYCDGSPKVLRPGV
jgi:hypothetical protein